ncbi:MAG TPA: hypothetical protein DCF95_09470 [Gammaproteobacteria bacterium]|nr:hypothetical protein [Gammaproteobacteria bacterium]|tara:strand:- start:426 stop:668 length:243 start_codon:yes stop_codon:yes gene_type:complete
MDGSSIGDSWEECLKQIVGRVKLLMTEDVKLKTTADKLREMRRRAGENHEKNIREYYRNPGADILGPVYMFVDGQMQRIN